MNQYNVSLITVFVVTILLIISYQRIKKIITRTILKNDINTTIRKPLLLKYRSYKPAYGIVTHKIENNEENKPVIVARNFNMHYEKKIYNTEYIKKRMEKLEMTHNPILEWW